MRANTTLPTSKVSTFPHPFQRLSLPSPWAAGRGLGNLSLFVLSRPFWTTFYVFIQAICSPGKGNRRRPAPQPLLAVSCLAMLPFQPAPARAGCCRCRGGLLFLLKYMWRGVGLWQRPPLLPQSGTAALFLTEVFLKTCSSLTKQL